jgi:hypothetical protein
MILENVSLCIYDKKGMSMMDMLSTVRVGWT